MRNSTVWNMCSIFPVNGNQAMPVITRMRSQRGGGLYFLTMARSLSAILFSALLLAACGRSKSPADNTTLKNKPQSVFSNSASAPVTASIPSDIHSAAAAAGPAAPADKAPDFIPEKLTADSDPQGRIAERVALTKELNQIMGAMAKQASILRKETRDFYKSDPDVNAMIQKTDGYLKQMKDRMAAVPGRREIESQCRHLEADLRRVRNQLAEAEKDASARAADGTSAEPEQAAGLRAREAELSDKLASARSSMARIELDTVSKDAQLEEWRVAAMALHSNIEKRVEANTRIMELRSEQVRLQAKRAELEAELLSQTGAGSFGVASAGATTPTWSVKAKAGQP